MHNLKEALATVGVHQGEFGALVGVSRVTVGSWCNGKSTPSKWVKDSVESVMTKLIHAHEDGLLYRLPDLSAAERMDFLRDLFETTSG